MSVLSYTGSVRSVHSQGSVSPSVQMMPQPMSPMMQSQMMMQPQMVMVPQTPPPAPTPAPAAPVTPPEDPAAYRKSEKMLLGAVVLLNLALAGITTFYVHETTDGFTNTEFGGEPRLTAICNFGRNGAKVTGEAKVTGDVKFRQTKGEHIIIDVEIDGVEDGTNYALDFYVQGDVGQACTNVGAQFRFKNPLAIASLEATDNGELTYTGSDPEVKLWGKNSVYGRSIVLTDSTERKIDCCVIGQSKDTN